MDGLSAEGPAPPRRRPAWRRRTTVAGALVVLAVVVAGLSVRLFVRPAVDRPRRADAIVVYGGGGPRVERGLELYEQGLAPVLVLSAPVDPGQPLSWYTELCAPGHPAAPLCFDPVPETTRGESRFVADLARARGWDEVIVVVTRDQVTRARMLLERCWDGDARFVAVDHDDPLVWRVVYEWGALARAVTVRRGC